MGACNTCCIGWSCALDIEYCMSYVLYVSYRSAGTPGLSRGGRYPRGMSRCYGGGNIMKLTDRGRRLRKIQLTAGVVVFKRAMYGPPGGPGGRARARCAPRGFGETCRRRGGAPRISQSPEPSG